MVNQSQWKKPLPTITGETRKFWDSARKGHLMIQHCESCGYQWYPRGFCSGCWSRDIDYVEAKGTGKVWTYTITYQNRTPGFKEEVPYVLALVELEEGVKLFTNIINCDPKSVTIGMDVKVTFVQATNQIHVPMFEPL